MLKREKDGNDSKNDSYGQGLEEEIGGEQSHLYLGFWEPG